MPGLPTSCANRDQAAVALQNMVRRGNLSRLNLSRLDNSLQSGTEPGQDAGDAAEFLDGLSNDPETPTVLDGAERAQRKLARALLYQRM